LGELYDWTCRQGINLKATKFANACPQVSELALLPAPKAEDCLYLNVFTPNLAGRNPVLMWIHGGGNFDGQSNDYDGSTFPARPRYQ
jgi:para-nitrobenzyl esterase